MKIRRIGCIMASLALSLGVCAARADEAKVKAELQALFKQSMTALKKKDLKGYMSLFAPDYKLKNAAGTQTRAQIEAELKGMIGLIKSVDSASLVIKKVMVKGDTVVAEGTVNMKMTFVDATGEMGPKGQTHTLAIVENSRDTFVKTSRGWKLKYSESLPGSTTTMDGMTMSTTPPKK